MTQTLLIYDVPIQSYEVINNMTQVYDNNSKKNAFKVLYNFEIQVSLPPCSGWNQI